MSGPVEFASPRDYPDAVMAGFEADLVVIRGLITPTQANKFADYLPAGKQRRLIINPFGRISRAVTSSIQEIKTARKLTRNWTERNLGKATAITQSPVAVQLGGRDCHVDIPETISITSVNLTPPDNQPVVLFSERIAPANSPYEDILKAMKPNANPEFSVELQAGDAIVIGRGMLHKSEAPRTRKTLIIASRI